VLGLLALGASLAHAQVEQANIGVRTKITDKWMRPKVGEKSAEGGHGKVFAILAVAEIKSDRRLVKPADERYLTGLLLQELAANGFQPYSKAHNPDILLTLSYGRGEVENPYFHNNSEVGGAGISIPTAAMGTGTPDAGNAPTVIMSGTVDVGQAVFDHKTPGHEAKLQKASYEKLFIRVTAWAYPTDAKAKPKMLWKTVIVADDPENRDLNALAAEMFKAGAPYFDKEVAEKEIDLYKPVPDGHVRVGTPEVVEAKTK